MIAVGKINGIRIYEDTDGAWYLLEDIRRLFKNQKLKGEGQKKYIKFNLGKWRATRLRLVNGATLLKYARKYSDRPIAEWKNVLKGVGEARRCEAR